MPDRISLYLRLLRAVSKPELAEFHRLGEDEAVAVGIELARRARLRPERHSRLDPRLVSAALEGTGQAQLEAALKLADVKFGIADAVKPLSGPPVSALLSRVPSCFLTARQKGPSSQRRPQGRH